MHEGVVPNTHARGSAQIDFPLITSGLDEHVIDVGVLDRSILQNDYSGMLFDLWIEGLWSASRQTCPAPISQSKIRRS
jgi:hypothetical protein